MTSQAILRNLQFQCFDDKAVFEKNFFLSSIPIFLFMIMSLMLYCVFSLWFCLVKCRLLYFLISIHSKNSIHLGLTKQKFKIWWSRLRALILEPPNFVKFYLFFISAYAENFVSSISWVKSLNFGGPSRGKTPILVPPNYGQILFFFYIILLTSNTSCFQLKR